MTMTRDADALQRIRRGFSTDYASLDALRRRGNRRGVALLFDEQGNFDEVVDLNGGAEHVEVTNEGNKVQVPHSFPEWSMEGPRGNQHHDNTRRMVEEASTKPYEPAGSENNHKTADAALLAAELKAKQTADAAKEKSIRLAAYRRNEELAARGKAFWSQKSV